MDVQIDKVEYDDDVILVQVIFVESGVTRVVYIPGYESRKDARAVANSGISILSRIANWFKKD